MIIVIGSLAGCLVLIGACGAIIYWRYKINEGKKRKYLEKDDEKYATNREL